MTYTNLTETAEPDFDGDLYHFLLGIALLGIDLGEGKAAIEISEVLCRLRPDLPQARISHAMGYMSFGQWAAAIRELEVALEIFPGLEVANALLGLNMKLHNRSGWERYLHAVIKSGHNEALVVMAYELLGQACEASAVHVDAGSSETENPSDFSSGYKFWA